MITYLNLLIHRWVLAHREKRNKRKKTKKGGEKSHRENHGEGGKKGRKNTEAKLCFDRKTTEAQVPPH